MLRAGRTAVVFAVSVAAMAGWAVRAPGVADSAAAAEASSQPWRTAAPLNVARVGHTATLLQDGKILVAGGSGRRFTRLASAELYDPIAGEWRLLPGSMIMARSGHTATLLPTGEVLVAGGYGPGGLTTPTSELYDPATQQWSEGPMLAAARANHTATKLDDGTVLVVGGTSQGLSELLSSAELYDRSVPLNGTWTNAGSLAQVRQDHTATLVDGDVLVIGGYPGVAGPSAKPELYDAQSKTWSPISPSATGAAERQLHTATLLPNGKVLVAGGQTTNSPPMERSSSLYDPGAGRDYRTGEWTTAGNLLEPPRMLQTAVQLTDGKVLLTGGVSEPESVGEDYPTIDSASLFDPGTEKWAAIHDSLTKRGGATATVLERNCAVDCGRVVVAGGTAENPKKSGEVLADVDVYTPAPTLRAIAATPGRTDQLTINGFGLASVKTVSVQAGTARAGGCGIPGTPACSFDPELPDSKLVVGVPAQPAGSVVTVTVVTDGGEAATSYTYPRPDVPAGGGTTNVTQGNEPGGVTQVDGQNTPPPATPTGGTGGGSPTPSDASAGAAPGGGAGTGQSAVPAAGATTNGSSASATSTAAAGGPPPPGSSGAVSPSIAAPPTPSAGGAHVAAPAQAVGNGAFGDIGEEAPQSATRYAMERAGPQGVPAAAFVGAALLMLFTCVLLCASDAHVNATADARSKGAY